VAQLRGFKHQEMICGSAKGFQAPGDDLWLSSEVSSTRR
jgi:hypothetical protein